MIDKVFSEKTDTSTDFQFNKKVVDVFDDMVVRSVPYYLEIQRMITELAKTIVKPDTSVYDLGCSTGTTIISMSKVLDESIIFVGIDESRQMLESCHRNMIEKRVKQKFVLQKANLNLGVTIENASLVIMCLTLQFIRPLSRTPLIQSIYDQLPPGGALILVEKVLGEGTVFNRRFIDYYYEYKRRNGYNELEIAQKREALENILIPYKHSEDIMMLLKAGFSECETFFKWYNFTGIVAVK